MTIAAIDAMIADLLKQRALLVEHEALVRRFHALPDELILIIRNYARERTPQERIARLYRHHAKIHELYIEPMELIKYAEKHPTKFGYLSITPKTKRVECYKKKDRIICSHVPFVELREKLWQIFTRRYHELLRAINATHILKQDLNQYKLRTLGQKMFSTRHPENPDFTGKYFCVYKNKIFWAAVGSRNNLNEIQAKSNQLLHEEAENFALEYA